MQVLLVDFITSLDGYASGEGWPGWWGLEGPDYLAWLAEQPEVTYLMGANTYRLMSGFAAGDMPEGADGGRGGGIDRRTHRRIEGRVLRVAQGTAHLGQQHARPRRTRSTRSGP